MLGSGTVVTGRLRELRDEQVRFRQIDGAARTARPQRFHRCFEHALALGPPAGPDQRHAQRRTRAVQAR